MTDQEYIVLDEWFRWIASNLNIGGDLIGKLYIYKQMLENSLSHGPDY